jgi:hypothetical protein
MTHNMAQNGFSMDELIGLTSKLARLMAEEVQHLKAMRLREVEALQPQKLEALRGVERLRDRVKANPAVLAGLSEEEREDFRSVAGMFESILVENHNRLKAARDINRQLMQIIRDSVAEQVGSPRYTARGDRRSVGAESMALRFNEMA